MTANLTSAPAKLGDPQIARDARPAAWYEVVTNGRMDRLMPAFASPSATPNAGSTVSLRR